MRTCPNKLAHKQTSKCVTHSYAFSNSEEHVTGKVPLLHKCLARVFCFETLHHISKTLVGQVEHKSLEQRPESCSNETYPKPCNT